MAANYQTMYKQAIDTSSKDYRAPFNKLTNAKSVATLMRTSSSSRRTSDSAVFVSMEGSARRADGCDGSEDRAKSLLASGQMIDLYTYNFAYLGTRAYGNDGGAF